MRSKKEHKFFLAADAFMLGKKKSRPGFFDFIWKFQILLRRCEYYKHKRGIFHRYKYYFLRARKVILGTYLGFDVPEGVFGPGLRINHFGLLVINGGARVGMWCDIHQGVNIGAGNPAQRTEDPMVPQIGNNCWIGPGSKIYGKINIGNFVQIGANSVVGMSFEDECTIAGVPAKVLSNQGTSYVDVAANKNRTDTFFELYPKYREFKDWKHVK